MLKGEQVGTHAGLGRTHDRLALLRPLPPPLTAPFRPPRVRQLLPCTLLHEGRHLSWLDPTARPGQPVRHHTHTHSPPPRRTHLA